MPRSFGYIPSRHDERDAPYTAKLRAALPAALPPLVDLRPPCDWFMRDQGQAGSCVGFGVAAFMELEFMLSLRRNWISVLSPLALYYWTREIENSVLWDAGAEPRDAMKVLLERGIPIESAWPYGDSLNRLVVTPDARANRSARPHRISSYHRLETLQDVKGCLASGHALTIGMDVYASFEMHLLEGGIVRMPYAGEQYLGGHCMCVVGYHDSPNADRFPGGGYLIVKNSWSEEWGLKGFCYLPYAYLNGYVSDLWTGLIY